MIVLSVLGLLWLNLERRSAEREFPRRAITILCSYSAGGGTDLLSRKVAQEAEKRLDVSVLVSNVTGGGGAVTALLGGHVDAAVASPAEMKTYADSGQLRLLGVMSEERIAGFEDVPTMREQGVDAVFGTWRGLALPKGVPEEARSVLLETFRAVIESEATRDFAAQSGMNLDVRGPEAFREMVEAQSGDVAETMEQLGLRRR